MLYIKQNGSFSPSGPQPEPRQPKGSCQGVVEANRGINVVTLCAFKAVLDSLRRYCDRCNIISGVTPTATPTTLTTI